MSVGGFYCANCWENWYRGLASIASKRDQQAAMFSRLIVPSAEQPETASDSPSRPVTVPAAERGSAGQLATASGFSSHPVTIAGTYFSLLAQ